MNVCLEHEKREVKHKWLVDAGVMMRLGSAVFSKEHIYRMEHNAAKRCDNGMTSMHVRGEGGWGIHNICVTLA